MITAIPWLALLVLVFGAAWALLAAGLRAGDCRGDTVLTAIEPDAAGRGVWLTIHNPGQQAILLGASLRRRSLRLACEAGHFVSVPRRTSRERLLAGRHAVICAVDGGETQTVLVSRSERPRGRAELVLAVGEADRLRIIHRAVELPRAHPDRRASASLGSNSSTGLPDGSSIRI